MAGESTTNSLAGLGPAQVSNVVTREPRDEAIASPAIHWQDANGSASVAQPILSGGISFTAITNGATEADAGSFSTISSTAVTHTPAFKAAYILLSSQSASSAAANLDAVMEGVLQRGAMTKLEVDIFTAVQGATNTVGTSGAAGSVALLQIAAVEFRENAKDGAARGMYLLHPKTFGDVEADALASNASVFVQRNLVDIFDGPTRAQSTAYRGVAFGYPVFISSNVQSQGGTDYCNALMRPFVPAEAEMGAGIGGGWGGMGAVRRFDQGVNRITGTSYAMDLRYAVAIEDNTKIVEIIAGI
jgi:hypothetical protein